MILMRLDCPGVDDIDLRKGDLSRCGASLEAAGAWAWRLRISRPDSSLVSQRHCMALLDCE